jgi:two-component system, NtrC family, response regulator AtoC
MITQSDNQLAASFRIAVVGSQECLRSVSRLLSKVPNIEVRHFSLKSIVVSDDDHAPHLLLLETEDGTNYVFHAELEEARLRFPTLPIIVLASQPDYASAVALVKKGVYQYCGFPSDQNGLFTAVTSVHETWIAQERQERFATQQQTQYDFSQIIGNSQKLQATLRMARKVILSEYMTTLILGETGTGKELLAKAIHYNSSNRQHPFVEIGCSAIPETLLESELFGYEKGAFTDARDRKIGLFEVAGKGTIFLDEIADISTLTQSKLLKVLEEKRMRRLGGFNDVPVEARIIAATSKNLTELVRKGQFRQDLYYRLKILPLHLPSLRERESDTLLLADHFLKHFNVLHRKNILGFSENAKHLLLRHQWEGNIRELKHSIERAIVLTDEDWIDERDFDLTFELYGKKYFSHAGEEGGEKPDVTSQITLSVSAGKATIAEIELLLTKEMLKRANGNKSQAAAMLGISRPRLDRLLKSIKK